MKPATALFRALCAACAALLLAGCGTLFSKSKAPDDEPIGLKLPPSMAADTEPPPVDMDDPWQRLRAGFAVTDIDDPEVLVLQNNLLKHPRSTRTALKNARRYLPLVLDELERLELRRNKRIFLSLLSSPMRLRTLTVDLELPRANESERLTLFSRISP